jgi:deazaflavin-dependent oxidoreductase (nitroreductase family)
VSVAPRPVTRWSNRLGVWLYRVSRGRLGGPGRGTTIALLTVPGRTTGRPRTVALGVHVHGGRYLVAATGGGAPREPDWFRNLRVALRADLQIKDVHLPVNVRVVEGVERDRLWREVLLPEAPWRAAYERASGRVIPVAVLTPVDPDD